MARLFRSVFLVACVLGAAIAQGAGLGKITINSRLGQIFDADIDLVAIQPGEADTLVARIATPETYRASRLEYAPVLRLLRFAVDKRADGQPFLKVTSSAPINEPSLEALIELSWMSGRVQRQYSVLLDPPPK
jgi:pilus assembly protein FimV